jgi:hypothetical protein
MTDLDGVASFDWTPPDLGTYSVMGFAGLGTTWTDVAWVTPRTETSLAFNGPWLDADGNGSTTLTAQLSSTDPACIEGKTLTFALDGVTLTAVTGTDGVAQATWLSSLDGVYDVTAAFDGDPQCGPSTQTAVVTIAPPGSFGVGGGWYKPTQQPVTKASFGLVAQRKCSKRGGCTFGGELVWVHHKNNRLKSTAITAISAPAPTTGFGDCSLISGVGTLTSWDVVTETWTAPESGIPFVATVCDGGVAGKKGQVYKPDAFGIRVETKILPGETGPVLLSGGSITLRN